MTDSSAGAGDHASLEALVESGLLALDTFHPGGFELTSELAELCGISTGSRVLDVACGTGATARHLTKQYGALVCGVDRSTELLERAFQETRAEGLAIQFFAADAMQLPFADQHFDVALCECTLCLLDKTTALHEMVRVVRPGGRIGFHDLAWQDDASESLKRRLGALEEEFPETLDGWRRLAASVGLDDLAVKDRSGVKRSWMRDVHRQLGLSGQLSLAREATRRWGLRGLLRILRSDRVFSSRSLGYVVLVGTRPAAD
jgi:arsenite methyltransferase